MDGVDLEVVDGRCAGYGHSNHCLVNWKPWECDMVNSLFKLLNITGC